MIIMDAAPGFRAGSINIQANHFSLKTLKGEIIMKKILSLIMAMMMVFSCAFALAEEPAAPEAPAAEAPALELPSIDLGAIVESIPAFTLDYNVKVDGEGFMNLMNAVAAAQGQEQSEEAMKVLQMIVPALADVSQKLVYANKGIQLEAGVQGQNICYVAAEKTEDGFALVTNLLPSLRLSVKDETLQTILTQLMGQFQEILGKLDMAKLQAAAQKLMNYGMEFAGAASKALVRSEPEMGEFKLNDDVTFNCKQTVALDNAVLLDAVKQFAGSIAADEDVAAAVTALQEVIPGLNINMNVDGLNEMTAEKLPAITGEMYLTVDENGQPADAVRYATITVKGETEEQVVNMDVLVTETSVNANVNVPSQSVALQLYGEMVEGGAVVTLAASVPNADLEADIMYTTAEDGSINVDEVLYVNDFEKPLITATETLTMSGERTIPVVAGEGMTDVALDEAIVSGDMSTVSGTVIMDFLFNGIGNVLGNLKEALPEQAEALEALVGQLMNSGFTGGATEEKAPEEEAPMEPTVEVPEEEAPADEEPVEDAEEEPAEEETAEEETEEEAPEEETPAEETPAA